MCVYVWMDVQWIDARRSLAISHHISHARYAYVYAYKHTHTHNAHRESDDVDVALDNVSGQSFAEALNEHLRAQGLETRSVGVIQVSKAWTTAGDGVHPPIEPPNDRHPNPRTTIKQPNITHPHTHPPGQPRAVQAPGDGARAGAGAVGRLHEPPHGDILGGVAHPRDGLRDGQGGAWVRVFLLGLFVGMGKAQLLGSLIDRSLSSFFSHMTWAYDSRCHPLTYVGLRAVRPPFSS